ncbi:RDD family protein [Haloarcula salinisoli]|uniref:RDD family protein n=1 Tax=Haloarcula salinisoli TaxID=2487746 RepID=A0A8J7YJX1_9EURY|nr:RDD family protein [Halomicroarcula salinisoli]MBX0285935.1 RDD family protein [Halomicroarcula salinisoli]MBX0302573.1 RDD family protein [Halomicroarcula salinisoli]
MATTSGSPGQLAGLGSRIVAFLIDSILTGIVGGIIVFPLFFLIGVGGETGPAGAGLLLIVQLLIPLVVFAYFIVMEGMYGYTVGKKLMSIRVVGENGSKIGFGESAIRNILRVVDALPTLYLVGIALIAINDDEQRLGDMAASTYVVKG